MANQDGTRYNYIENVLQDINRDYIALSKYEKQINNMILKEVLEQIIEKMSKKDALFSKLFRRKFYGGSYYDGLKVSKPNEYDLDLLLSLPKSVHATVCKSEDVPGFVHVKIQKKKRRFYPPTHSQRNQQSNIPPSRIVPYSELSEKLSTDNFLSTSKVLSWIQSVLTLVVNEFPPVSEEHNDIKKINTSHGIFYCVIHQKGPAFTLKLKGKVSRRAVEIDIDLVPCFVFSNEKWPPHPYRQNPFPDMQTEFFVVPKKPGNTEDASLYWRLSFQEQEGVIIGDLQNLKPSLRLLKRLRDLSDLCIASYYLKNIYLWEVQENNRNFWKGPLSYVFMTMLKKYQEYVRNGNIPYFWNEANNLIDHLDQTTLDNISNRLQRIINGIEDRQQDPRHIVKYFTDTTLESSAETKNYWSSVM